MRSPTPTTPGGSTYDCGPKSAGSGNAATGNSAGFQDWRVALNNADHAGDQVEVSIVYQTDPGTLGLGAYVDDASVTSGGDTLSTTSFEDGLGGWTIPGALPGSPGNTNDWERAQSIGLVDGPGVRTGHSIMWGFGLEAVDGAGKREALLRNAMRYFGALD